jgi:uncharacterized spore protein YtfJ
MDQEIQKLLDNFAELKEKASVEAAFGEPVTIDGRTVIPVAQVGYAFGMGMGEATKPEEDEDQQEGQDMGGSGAGGGGGAMSRPLAVVEVTAEGTQVRPVVDEQLLMVARSLVIVWASCWLAWALTRIFGRKAS